jgi:hypothetical protein
MEGGGGFNHEDTKGTKEAGRNWPRINADDTDAVGIQPQSREGTRGRIEENDKGANSPGPGLIPARGTLTPTLSQREREKN